MKPGRKDGGESRKRVLVADDESALRQLALEVLTQAGYEVVLAADGCEAVSRLDTGRFDLILLDESMPGLTGREVLARLRAQGSPTPALLWSGHATLSDRERSGLGILGVLRKPIGVEVLERTVRRALDGEGA